MAAACDPCRPGSTLHQALQVPSGGTGLFATVLPDTIGEDASFPAGSAFTGLSQTKVLSRDAYEGLQWLLILIACIEAVTETPGVENGRYTPESCSW
ncbi:uncharacterized protein CMC5_065450 [Chondromyces crocatus]|uniref:Uncharacterized protein n=1 Tax=Chondromyces crocatus TaxID=52 RepID=A0A0K1ENA4_CHOCO|nr:uncharacterized protein CMC5_065450 [Chondromyces crocatus]